MTDDSPPTDLDDTWTVLLDAMTPATVHELKQLIARVDEIERRVAELGEGP